MDVLEAISGNLVHYAITSIGGVNQDIRHPEAILAAVREVRRVLERAIIPVFTTDRTVRAPASGVGVLR